MSMVKKTSKNFTALRAKPRPVTGLEFTTETKETKTSGSVTYLKDSTGAICGAYADEAAALKAMPLVKRNLERGYIPYQWLKRAKRNPGQFLH